MIKIPVGDTDCASQHRRHAKHGTETIPTSPFVFGAGVPKTKILTGFPVEEGHWQCWACAVGGSLCIPPNSEFTADFRWRCEHCELIPCKVLSFSYTDPPHQGSALLALYS